MQGHAAILPLLVALKVTPDNLPLRKHVAELDGFNQKDNEGGLILAATNAPWHLDAASGRPGRFDRTVFVPPADQESRASALRIMLRLSRLGRYALSDEQRQGANWFGAVLFVGIGVGVVGLATGQGLLLPVAAGIVALTIPVASVFYLKADKRLLMVAYSVCLAAVGAGYVASVALGSSGGAGLLGVLFILGAVGSTWVASFLATMD